MGWLWIVAADCHGAERNDQTHCAICIGENVEPAIDYVDVDWHGLNGGAVLAHGLRE